MGHHLSAEPLSIRPLTMALLASGLLACSLVDDEPPAGGVGDTDPTNDVCVAQLEAAEAECLDGMTFHSMFEASG